MIGISWAEFLVILLVGVVVIPARMWPDVARFLATAITMIRKLIWKITDASEQIRNQIDLEKPIDEIIRTTTDDMLDGISEPLKKISAKKSGAGNKKLKTGSRRPKGQKCSV